MHIIDERLLIICVCHWWSRAASYRQAADCVRLFTFRTALPSRWKTYWKSYFCIHFMYYKVYILFSLYYSLNFIIHFQNSISIEMEKLVESFQNLDTYFQFFLIDPSLILGLQSIIDIINKLQIWYNYIMQWVMKADCS